MAGGTKGGAREDATIQLLPRFSLLSGLETQLHIDAHPELTAGSRECGHEPQSRSQPESAEPLNYVAYGGVQRTIGTLGQQIAKPIPPGSNQLHFWSLRKMSPRKSRCDPEQQSTLRKPGPPPRGFPD